MVTAYFEVLAVVALEASGRSRRTFRPDPRSNSLLVPAGWLALGVLVSQEATAVPPLHLVRLPLVAVVAGVFVRIPALMQMAKTEGPGAVEAIQAAPLGAARLVRVRMAGWGRPTSSRVVLVAVAVAPVS